jgi:hypothetical protein
MWVHVRKPEHQLDLKDEPPTLRFSCHVLYMLQNFIYSIYGIGKQTNLQKWISSKGKLFTNILASFFFRTESAFYLVSKCIQLL